MLVVAAVVLRVVGLGERPLFRDEAASWLESSYALPRLLDHAAGEPYPPLYALLLHGWLRLFGDGEVALRSLSVLPGLALVGVVWRWAHEALGRWPALVALAVVVFSPLAIANARDARMYAWEALFATVAWWLLWRLLSGRAGRSGGGAAVAVHGVVLALAVAGELWTLALGLVVAAWQGLVVVVALSVARRREGGPGPGPRTALRTPSLVALAAVAAGGVSFLPWLPWMLSAATSGEPYWTPTPGLFDWILTWQVAVVGWGGNVAANAAAALLLGLVAIGVVGLVRSAVPERRLLGWLVVAAVALVPSVWAVSLVRSIYDHRYFGAAVGPLALAVAAGSASVAQHLRRTGAAGEGPLAASRGLAVLALVPILCAPFAAAWVVDSVGGGGQSPVRALVQVIALRVRPGDSLLAIDARAYFPLDYEVSRAAAADPRLRLPVLHWVSGTEPRYNGASLIDASADVDDAALERLGWHAALRLRPAGRVWLVASGSDAGGPFDITILRDPAVTAADSVLLGADLYEPAQAVLLEIGRP